MAVFERGRLAIVQGDITTLAVDAIVNAANAALCGGGGVDGAIHRAAGPELLKICRTLVGAATGEVKMTPGFQLPAKHIMHAVGPVWRGGERGEPEQLRSCYARSLQLLLEHDLSTIAFPAISTGAYRFPLEAATTIAVETAAEFLGRESSLKRVTFCCFSDSDARVYERVAQRVLAP